MTEITAGKRTCENHLRVLAAVIPSMQFFQNPAFTLSGSLKCISSFQNFTAFQDVFLWHATVFPDFTQNFPLERRHFLWRLVLSSVQLTSLEIELGPIRNPEDRWPLVKPGICFKLALQCFFLPPMASMQASGVTRALINSLKAYLYQPGVRLCIVFSIHMQLPLGFSWACIQY